MNSAIFRGKVRHRRFQPKEHKFSYRLYLNWIDLDEVKKAFNIPLILSCGRLPAIIKFNRKHYMSPETENLKKTVLDRIENDLGFRPEGKVCILTTIQYFGLCYNPVSFYFAYDRDGTPAAVASEINNTPWDQRFTYCHDLRKGKRHRFKKEFHISPFMPMEMDYTWFFHLEDEKIFINMQNFENGKLVFDATLKLAKQNFSVPAMIKSAILYPLMPVKIMAGIYYHAFRLWLKTTPFHEHPENNIESKEYSHE